MPKIRKGEDNMAIKPVSGEIKAQVLNDNFSALDSQLTNLSIGPFDTYTNLSALQSAYPNGRNGFAVVLESDGKTGYMYTWTGTTWKKGGLAQAMGIANKSVTRQKTDYYIAKNSIYNIANFTSGGYHDAFTGSWITSSDFGSVSIKDFEYNVLYRMLNLLQTTNRHITFWHNGVYQRGASYNEFTITSSYDEVRVSIREVEKLQVEIVPKLDDKILYADKALIIDDGNIGDINLSPDKVEFIDKKPSETNKFYKPNFRNGGSYRYTTGVWEPSENYFTSNQVQVNSGDIVRTKTKGSATMYTNFWDVDGNWLSGINKATDVTVPANVATVTCTFNAGLGDTPDKVMITVNLPMTEEYVSWYQYELSKEIKVSSVSDETPYLTNDLKGKTLVATGDSIVSAEDRYSESITGYIKLVADYFGMNLKNYAISGSTVAVKESSPTERTPISTRFSQMDDGDIIYIQCGTNDWQYQWTPVGTMSDRTVNTFYGALHVTLLGLMTKYPVKQIIYGLPIKRRIIFEDTNDLGLTLKEYCDVIKEVCGYYSIPIIDLYNTSMLNPHIPAQKDAYLPDGTHPNKIGHEILSKPVISYFKDL